MSNNNMKKTQNRKIMAALKDLEAGMAQKEVAKKYGILQGTLSKWKTKYGIISQNIPSNNQNIPSLDNNIPSDNDSGDDYDYDDEANDLLERNQC